MSSTSLVNRFVWNHLELYHNHGISTQIRHIKYSICVFRQWKKGMKILVCLWIWRENTAKIVKNSVRHVLSLAWLLCILLSFCSWLVWRKYYYCIVCSIVRQGFTEAAILLKSFLIQSIWLVVTILVRMHGWGDLIGKFCHIVAFSVSWNDVRTLY